MFKKFNTILINTLKPRVETSGILRYFPSSSRGKDTDPEEQLETSSDSHSLTEMSSDSLQIPSPQVS